MDGAISELFVMLPNDESSFHDTDAALLLDAAQLYVLGPTGRLLRIDTRTRELTLMAACKGWDDDDFRAVLGMDEAGVYFIAASGIEDGFSLLRVQK